MWPFTNFRQVQARKRDKRPQRLNYKNNFNVGDYWNSHCELEVRYYLSRVLQKEFASGLAGRPVKKRKAFIYRNKRAKIAGLYIKKFNNQLSISIASDSRICRNNFRTYQKITSLGNPCMLCGGCFMGENDLCRKAQGSVLHKYGFFRKTITY